MSDILTCACGQRNRVATAGPSGDWKCAKCGAVLRADRTIAEPGGTQDCAVCGASLPEGPKALGKHLWTSHEITPNDYRVRYLGLPPKCSRPGCENPVPRTQAGAWFKCCSPFCAMEMGEDIPLGR